MAKIKTKTIRWNPSPDSDVAVYRVYYAKGSAVDYTNPFIETTNTEVIAPNDFPADAFDEDVDYTVGVTAVDDQGNESDMVVLSHPFDFIPPSAVSGLVVE